MAAGPGGGLDDDRAGIAAMILRLRRRGITDRRVLVAIESVPRSLFVPPAIGRDAYADRALPIDCGQTISAPGMVGMMTAALEVGEDDRVLEIGTGSGYQTAVLARLARRVYTVDRFRTLVETALSRFRTLRLTNVVTMVGDGMLGWPEEAPFDRIVVTASGEEVPAALESQLRVGGILVMPVGPPDGLQELKKIVRTESGFEESTLAEVRFVPLIPGKAARL
jgi:protein-L-isoaspartate(D-aspartate) O-methyltransferase